MESRLKLSLVCIICIGIWRYFGMDKSTRWIGCHWSMGACMYDSIQSGKEDILTSFVSYIYIYFVSS